MAYPVVIDFPDGTVVEAPDPVSLADALVIVAKDQLDSAELAQLVTWAALHAPAGGGRAVIHTCKTKPQPQTRQLAMTFGSG